MGRSIAYQTIVLCFTILGSMGVNRALPTFTGFSRHLGDIRSTHRLHTRIKLNQRARANKASQAPRWKNKRPLRRGKRHLRRLYLWRKRILRTRRPRILLLLPFILGRCGRSSQNTNRLNRGTTNHLLVRPARLPNQGGSEVGRRLLVHRSLLVRRRRTHLRLVCRHIGWRPRLPRRRLQRLKRPLTSRRERLRERRPSHLKPGRCRKGRRWRPCQSSKRTRSRRPRPRCGSSR
jgi:hypothetical protein